MGTFRRGSWKHVRMAHASSFFPVVSASPVPDLEKDCPGAAGKCAGKWKDWRKEKWIVRKRFLSWSRAPAHCLHGKHHGSGRETAGRDGTCGVLLISRQCQDGEGAQHPNKESKIMS